MSTENAENPCIKVNNSGSADNSMQKNQKLLL